MKITVNQASLDRYDDCKIVYQERISSEEEAILINGITEDALQRK